MNGYYAKILYNKEDDAWEVSFPDLPEVNTFGVTKEHAIEMAADALNGYMVVAHQVKSSIPEPKASGKRLVLIQLDPSIAFAVWLKHTREKSGLTQAELANAVGMKYQAYQRNESPGKANPTLKTIAKIKQALGVDVVVV